MARTSTYRSLLIDRGATFGVWLGVPVVDAFGDVDAEYTASTEDLAIADLSGRGTVIAEGTEVVPLLQGVVTSDVFALAEPGAGQRSTAVNAKGRLICDLRLLHGPDLLIMDFEPGMVEQGVISHFRANVMSEDARFVDRTDATSIIGLYGPRAAETVDLLALLERPVGSLSTYQGTWGSLDGYDVVVRRSNLGFEILVDAEHAAQLWEHLEAQGAAPIGEHTLEILRVEAGVPRWGAELDEKVIPLEASLEETISFDKGCYVGQEIIARLDTLGRPAKLLRKLEMSPDVDVAIGDVVFDGDKKVGSVRTVVKPPNGGPALALAFIKRDHNDPGRTIEVGPSRVAAVLCSL